MPDPGRDRPDFERAMRRIWLSHLPLNRERLAALEEVAAALEAGALDQELRTRGEHEAHKMAGGAGSFGYEQVTELARKLEVLLREGAVLDPAAFRRDVDELQRRFQRTLE